MKTLENLIDEHRKAYRLLETLPCSDESGQASDEIAQSLSLACDGLTRCERAIMRYRPTNADQARLKVKEIKAFGFMTGIEPSQEDIDALIHGMLWD